MYKKIFNIFIKRLNPILCFWKYILYVRLLENQIKIWQRGSLKKLSKYSQINDMGRIKGKIK